MTESVMKSLQELESRTPDLVAREANRSTENQVRHLAATALDALVNIAAAHTACLPNGLSLHGGIEDEDGNEIGLPVVGLEGEVRATLFLHDSQGEIVDWVDLILWRRTDSNGGLLNPVSGAEMTRFFSSVAPLLARLASEGGSSRQSR